MTRRWLPYPLAIVTGRGLRWYLNRMIVLACIRMDEGRYE